MPKLLEPDEPISEHHETYACGCSLANGRCDAHATKMVDLHEAYFSVDMAARKAVCALANGCGLEGECPDWSAVRDSTPGAVDRMYAALRQLGELENAV